MGPRCVTGQKLNVEELFSRQRYNRDRLDVHIKFSTFEEKLRQSAEIKTGIQAAVYTDPGCS